MPNRGLHIALWVVQVLLGLVFCFAGFNKLTKSEADLVAMGMTFVPNVGLSMTRFIGTSEILGGLGLIIPAATRIAPILTPVAAAALVLVMVLAAGYHIMHGEAAHIGPNIVLGGLAGFVAWGRFTKAPISKR